MASRHDVTSCDLRSARQVAIVHRGGPEVLRVEPTPLAIPREGQICLRVSAAGVTFADILMREGLYPGRPRYPFVPGVEVVGNVEARGKEVADLNVGQRVVALCGFGGYTERLVLDASLAVPVPDGITDIKAVALVVNYLTAYQMLRRMARLEPDEAVLVHGAAGGVGTALLDLAAWMDLRAFGTASGSKHAAIRRFGAHLIDYRTEDFADAIRQELCDGVDAIFDAIGGGHWRRSLSVLRPGGRLVAYGFSEALRGGRRRTIGMVRSWLASPRPHPLSLMTANTAIVGYGAQNLRLKRLEWYREDLETLLDLCAGGRIDPIIARLFPLEEAKLAHELLGAGAAVARSCSRLVRGRGVGGRTAFFGRRKGRGQGERMLGGSVPP